MYTVDMRQQASIQIMLIGVIWTLKMYSYDVSATCYIVMLIRQLPFSAKFREEFEPQILLLTAQASKPHTS